MHTTVRRLLRYLSVAVCFGGVVVVGVLAINAAREGGGIGAWFHQKAPEPAFTLYAPQGSQPVFSRTDKTAISITAQSDITLYESRVLAGQETTIAPPYACDFKLLQQYMRGKSDKQATIEPPYAEADAPGCGKVGYTKDDKPLYQQYIASGDREVYYYTRLGVTHVVVVIPLDVAADPNRSALQEVLAVVNSLQPVGSDTVRAAP